MNFVFLSPHFPPHYAQFSNRLNELGVNVLGLADEPYDLLRPELRSVLGEYYRVNDMHNYDQLLRALGYFTHKWGKIDRIDSLNEYWLETEARLRTDFNIPGLQQAEIAQVKRKSLMKKVYEKAGVAVARGRVVNSLAEARKLIGETGFPVVAKPDIGVGAAKTYKLYDFPQLERFFEEKPPVDYILEEFVQGSICSFDGLTDRSGSPVFYTAHEYSSGIMEVVNDDSNVFYYSLREIPADLEAAGRKTLKAFGVRERFFHFEFFRRESDGQIVALEVNMRPPGGWTTDMFNFANDIDIYREWAHVIVHDRFTAEYSRPYHVCYVGRKYNRSYCHSHADILKTWGPNIVHHEEMTGVFSTAMGNYGYLVRSPDLQGIYQMAQYIQEVDPL